MQGYVFNLRRPKFADPRLRQAFNWAMDFESINKELFFGQYKRISSYFDGTELAASGLPQGLELEILESVRSEIPPEVFTTPYANPVGGSPQAVRTNLREATRLLDAAGYTVRNLQARQQEHLASRSASSSCYPMRPTNGSSCSIRKISNVSGSA